MKKLIPVITAIVLIIVVVAISVGVKVMEKYSYSKERADLEEYFDINSEGEVAIVLGNERVEESARLMDGVYYFDLATVHKYFNERFYEDKNEQLLLYTLPEETVRVEIGSSSYITKDGPVDLGYPAARYAQAFDGSGEILYVAADYVKLFTGYSYQTFTGPDRMQVYANGHSGESIKTAVRYQGGVKSPILKDVMVGEQVAVLEEMENWSKVKTEDAIIGYVENKRLGESGAGGMDVSPQPQTENASAFVNPEFTSISRRWQERQEMIRWHRLWRIQKG